MNRAELKVIYFSDTDVIATSTFKLDGLMNGVNGDATFNGESLTNSKYFADNTYTFYDGTGTNGVTGDSLRTDKDGTTEDTIIKTYGSGHNYGSTFNGTYIFDSVKKIFTKQTKQ